MRKKANFIRNHKLFAAVCVLALLLILTAVFAPFIAPCDPYDAVLTDALQPPGASHLFGTDKLGRDLFSRVIYGARISLSSSLLLVAVIFAAGTALGILSGYFGGWIDTVVMRAADIMIAFPGIVLAIAVAGILGASIKNAVIAVSIVSWPKYARLSRSMVLRLKNSDFIAAAKVTGSTTPHLFCAYLLPNILPMLLITAATDIGSMMLELAGLSFLGFGAKAPQAEWGLMLNEGRSYMQAAPWMMLYPGLAILITVVVFNLLGDSLRDILDPREEEAAREAIPKRRRRQNKTEENG